MRLTVLGCGDAFGSGGRLQTCFHVDLGGRAFLIDCGATSLIGMQQAALEPDDVDTILVSHLHGDHFSGIVWWLLHAVHVVRRSKPLTIAGPVGIEARVHQAVDVLFPGALRGGLPFAMSFVEQVAGPRLEINGIGVTAFEVSHPSGAPSHALRIETGDRTIAFSGDTEWVEALVPCGAGADLFLCECYAFDAPARYHMRWSTLRQHLPRIRARRVVLTHMSCEMLARAGVLQQDGVVLAKDGLVLEL